MVVKLGISVKMYCQMYAQSGRRPFAYCLIYNTGQLFAKYSKMYNSILNSDNLLVSSASKVLKDGAKSIHVISRNLITINHFCDTDSGSKYQMYREGVQLLLDLTALPM